MEMYMTRGGSPQR